MAFPPPSFPSPLSVGILTNIRLSLLLHSFHNSQWEYLPTYGFPSSFIPSPTLSGNTYQPKAFPPPSFHHPLSVGILTNIRLSLLLHSITHSQWEYLPTYGFPSSFIPSPTLSGNTYQHKAFPPPSFPHPLSVGILTNIWLSLLLHSITHSQWEYLPT